MAIPGSMAGVSKRFDRTKLVENQPDGWPLGPCDPRTRSILLLDVKVPLTLVRVLGAMRVGHPAIQA